MKPFKIKTSTTLRENKSVEGETIETKMERIVNNKEPIKDGAPLIYTERKEGVRPSTNIRTDRFEIAAEAMDKITKSVQATRENNQLKLLKNEEKQTDITTGETTHGTETTTAK